MEPDVSAIFPSNVPVFRCPLSSTGSLGSVPPLPRYYEALRLPAAHPASLRFLRFAVPPLRLWASLPRAQGAAPAGQGLFTGFPITGFTDGDDRSSQVPGEPAMGVPCSSTPAGPPRSATSALRCCLPPFKQRRLSRELLFRGSITRPTHSLSTLRRVGCPTATQDSLPDGWPTLSGRDWLPAGPQRKVSADIILLSQASPGAPKRYCSVLYPQCRPLLQDPQITLRVICPSPLFHRSINHDPRNEAGRRPYPF